MQRFEINEAVQSQATQDRWAQTVCRAQQQDSRALLLLLEEFENLIQAACRRFVVPFNERGDLQQEAYIGFLKAIQTFDPTLGSTFAYYAKLQTQAAVWQYMRVRRRYLQGELAAQIKSDFAEEEPVTPLDLFADPFAETEFSELEWRSWLASLSEREAAVIEQVVIDGMTMAELARIEGVSPGTVKTWKQRAFAKIRAELKKT